MLNVELIESALEEVARRMGIEMNGRDRLLLRTGIASALAREQQHLQRMAAPDYQWKKPERQRR